MFRTMKGNLRIAMYCGIGWGLMGCNVDGRWVQHEPSQAGPGANTTAKTDPGGGVDISMVEVQEVDLVETLLGHRTEYRKSLQQLHGYYVDHGYMQKAQWATFELKGLQGVKQFRYLLDAEVVSEMLRPEKQIPEADELYEQGLELMRGGGHGIPAFYREDRMVQAANVLRRLIEQYPSSDKIDDAAFYLGEIHKEYLPNQEEIAVKWYERAWTWDPATPHPARFQAAVIHDYRLHDRDRALELYQGVVKYETAIPSNVRWAVRRINELTTSDQTAQALPR